MLDKQLATNSTLEAFKRWLFVQRGAERVALLYHRRIFTLPSRAGWAFLLTLATLLVGSINYQLSLGYALTFFAAAMAWVALHFGFANLSGLQFSGAQAQPVFAGETAAFEFTVADTKKRARYAVRVSSGLHESRLHIAANEEGCAVMLVTSTQRGWLEAPRATIDCVFPLGLWRIWAYWQPAARCLVYPAPEKNAPPLPMTAEGVGDADGGRAGNDNFAQVRPYQAGDSLRQIAWKAVARSDGETLATKQFEGGAANELWLDWRFTGVADFETQLSRLAAWVLAAQAQGLEYGLRLRDVELPPAHGETHRDACLKALATA